MGNRLLYQADKSFEGESVSISAFIALDGSSNVIGYAPTASIPTAAGPYTRALGLQKSIGPAGGIITQPHTGTGVYVFTLDDPWYGAIEGWVQQIDPGAVNLVTPYVDANVGAAQVLGAFPGNNPALAAQTVRVRFRGTTGTLTDPAASTGFWLGLKLRRSGVPQ